MITSAVTVFLILASTQMKVNNFLMDDLRESEPIKQDFRFLDDHYGGIRPLEIGIHLKDTTRTIWDEEVLADLENIENYLAKEYQAKINISLVQTLKVLNRSSYSGNPTYFKLPTKKSQIRKSKQLLRMANQGKWLATMLDSTETNTRIGGNIGDWGNVHLQKKNEAFKRFLKQNIDTQLLEVNITGTAHLIDKNMRYLSTNLIQGIIVSILLITFLMGLLFRSLRMVAISLIPNLIPLLVLSGIMGLVGIDLKISTAIIFTIAFGIAVDDTIHFLGKFKFELQKGKSKLYALKRTYITTGKAMILTTLILCCGFAMLIFSSFMGTFIMGLMITVTLLSALILDLTVLPILILIFYHPKERQVVKKP
jgi:predicted RND superfamily exporter protein